MQNKFITLISKIKEHPTAFLGKRSLQLLRIYIDGYLYAMQQEEIDCGESVYYAFNGWLAKSMMLENLYYGIVICPMYAMT